ncbi:MAG: DUF3365 domain-containing protein [Flavobacteriaceae bacterium]|nr:DUF3365 domain-containing protein [Flavobacteriaceae bacterium]
MKTPFYFIALISLVLFSSCKNETKETISASEKAAETEEASSKIEPSYAQIGLDMAFSTKAQLGKNLMGTMKKKGTKEALKFCNVRAIPLTDSMATVHRARIKRVSDKTRNPNNKANETELKNIETFKNALANGEEIAPILETKNDSVYFYYPIVTNGMCLKCHGSKDSIDEEVLASLNTLYPTDTALDYSENQVRGIWSIQFKQK